MFYTIKDKDNFVTIEDKGAQLKNIFIDGTEYLWQGDEENWPRRAPNLFPICGRLLNDSFFIGDTEYKMSRHGFLRDEVMEVKQEKENAISFILKDNERTLAKYPYKFETRVEYELVDSKLIYKIKVINADDKDIYFSVGTHTGISLNQMEGYSVDDYVLKLGENENPTNLVLTKNGLLSGEKETLKLTNGEVPLDTKVLSETLALSLEKSESISLINKKTKKEIKFSFDPSYSLVLWSNQGKMEFICIEPWAGLPDMDFEPVEFTKKAGNIKLEKGGAFNYKIEIQLINN